MKSPEEKRDAEFEIRIRRDGRLYMTGLPAELLELAAELNPNDEQIARRLRLLRQVRESGRQTKE